MRPDYMPNRRGSLATRIRTPSLPACFRHLVDGPGHAGGDAKDVASRPRGKRAPVFETSYARRHQAVEQVLIAECRRILIVDLLITQISDHDDALTASSPTLTYRSRPDSDRHRMSFADCNP